MDEPWRQERGLTAARQRAAAVAAVAGLLLVPWFLASERVAGFRPGPPAPTAPASDFVAFYADNASRIPLNATLFALQWVIQLVLLVGIVLAVHGRMGVAAVLSVTLAGAATAIYIGAEGVRVWPALSFDLNAGTVRGHVDPAVAQASVLARDGLHIPGSVLSGVSVLVIAWMLARSDLWGHSVMSGLGAVAGAVAIAGVDVGPAGSGPGFVLVLWGPAVAVILLVGRWMQRPRQKAVRPGHPVPPSPGHFDGPRLTMNSQARKWFPIEDVSRKE